MMLVKTKPRLNIKGVLFSWAGFLGGLEPSDRRQVADSTPNIRAMEKKYQLTVPIDGTGPKSKRPILWVKMPNNRKILWM